MVGGRTCRAAGVRPRARQTARRADAIRRHHAAITRALAATGGTAASLPLPDFQWALSTVWARAHTVSLPNGPPEGCLAPLLDLFNAETRSPSMQPAETTIRKVGGEGVDGSGSDGALTIRAARSLSIGEEATVPYGHHNPRDLSNARALLDYGFCVDDKVDEYGEDVALPLTADNCTAGGLIATEALEALHLPTSNGNNNGHDGGRHPPPRIGHGHDPIPPELNAFARVCVMSADVAANTKELAIKGTDPKLFQRLGAPLGHWDQKAAAALARACDGGSTSTRRRRTRTSRCSKSRETVRPRQRMWMWVDGAARCGCGCTRSAFSRSASRNGRALHGRQARWELEA